MDNHGDPGLFTEKPNGAIGPVDVLALEIGDVALAGAQVPAELIKSLSLGVVLVGEDLLVLLDGDGAFLLENNGWPLSQRNYWTRQPVHIESKIVQLAQMHIRRNRSNPQRIQKVFALRFDQSNWKNPHQRSILGGTFPTLVRRTVLGLNDGIQDVLPRALSDHGIAGHQIRPGNLQVDGWILERLISGAQNSNCFDSVSGSEALLFFVDPVLKKEYPALLPEQAVTQFHRHPHGCR